MGDQVLSADMAMVATTTGGTGAAQLGAAPATYLHPGTQIPTNGLVTWREVNADGSQWQIFRGRYVAGSPNVITRETLLLRSDGGTTFINWQDGQTRYIFPDVFARDAVLMDTDGRIQLPAPLQGNHAVGRDWALGVPVAQRGCLYIDWSNSGFGVTTSNVNLIYYNVPAKSRRIEGGYWLDAANTDGTTAVILTQVALINQASGADIAQRAGAISRSSNGIGGGLGGTFNFTFDTPVGDNVLLALRVRKGASTGSVFAYNGGLYADVMLDA
ncbi:hypothetical protein [Roseomonas elaeocarpi]|uniref:Uncharacterized protein n=1 Tax=Roseomonas elaeocarpi TaxID=907779 RepID=A0ABV6JZA1_9PROT